MLSIAIIAEHKNMAKFLADLAKLIRNEPNVSFNHQYRNGRNNFSTSKKLRN
jgi:hypothetical protein